MLYIFDERVERGLNWFKVAGYKLGGVDFSVLSLRWFFSEELWLKLAKEKSAVMKDAMLDYRVVKDLCGKVLGAA